MESSTFWSLAAWEMATWLFANTEIGRQLLNWSNSRHEMSFWQDMKGSAASGRLTTASPSPAGMEPPVSAAWLGLGATVPKVGRFWNQIQLRAQTHTHTKNIFIFLLWLVISFCLCVLHLGKYVMTKKNEHLSTGRTALCRIQELNAVQMVTTLIRKTDG